MNVIRKVEVTAKEGQNFGHPAPLFQRIHIGIAAIQKPLIVSWIVKIKIS